MPTSELPPLPAPDDPRWLRALVTQSPLLRGTGLDHLWRTLLPTLTGQQRHALAALLFSFQQELDRAPGP